MKAIDEGLDLVRRACDDGRLVPSAVQTLRNWYHRLDRLSVLDVAAQREVQTVLRALVKALGELHGDQESYARRRAEALERVTIVRDKLVALVGHDGMN